MRKRIMLALVAACEVTCLAALGNEDTVCLPDVVGQFLDLKHHGEALGFHLRGYSESTCCDKCNPLCPSHYQGIVRYSGPGTPYFYVSKDDPAEILVVRMGSRNGIGERLRSNRLEKGTLTQFTVPSQVDEEIGTAEPRTFQNLNDLGLVHVGGMQIIGDILVAAVEVAGACEAPLSCSVVALLDIAEPESPVVLHIQSFSHKNGANAIVRLPNDGRYLLLVSGSGMQESVLGYLSNVTDLRDPNLQFDSFYEATTPPEWHGYEHISALKQCDGELFLVGTWNTFLKAGDDLAELWELDVNVVVGSFSIKYIGAVSRHYCSDVTYGRICNFDAAAGFYVSPGGELILYAAEHENGGPAGTVRVGEFRHIDVVRANSQTLDPTVDAGGPYSVDDGETTTLMGSGAPPATLAWAEIFEDANGWTDGPGIRDSSIVFDLADRYKDDYLNFNLLNFNDEAHSVRWRAPIGCCIELIENPCPSDETGGILQLEGTGQVAFITNLQDPLYDFHDQASALRFSFDAVDPPFCDSPKEDNATCLETVLSYAWDVLGPNPPGFIQPPVDQPSVVFQALEPGEALVRLTVCTGSGHCAEDVAQVTVVPRCPWDCGGSADGNVNVTDLLALIGQYDPLAPGRCDGGESCDFDGNGCVDVTDLIKLLAHFTTNPAGTGCP